MVTVEDITKFYKGNDTQEKIKNFLHFRYKENNLKYVLLGGDDTVVPVRGCYGSVASRRKNSDGEYESYTYVDKTVPTDLYYACFEGSFTWDDNGNGIYGEVADNINLSQSVYITRIPIRTRKDISAFISRLLQYEQSPKYKCGILMSGSAVGGLCNDSSLPDRPISDTEAQCDNLYKNSIQPYWKWVYHKFYDTYTHFAGGANYDFTRSNLQDILSKGYAFADIATHGNQTILQMEYGAYYNTTDAASLINPAHTIITTSACLTNAFDTSSNGLSDPCLSESFIRNELSGVIAYLGSSRYGWCYKNTSAMGQSLLFESYYYKYLLSNKLKDKNFGAVVAATKAARIGYCSTYGAPRWLQFSINPIGDPEMPIFTIAPKKFLYDKITHTPDSTIIDTNVEDCRICVMSSNDNGASFYEVFENCKRARLRKLPAECSICITKQNYIPKLYTFTNGYIQNVTLTGTNEYNYDVVRIGSNVTPSKAEGPVVFEGGTTTIDAKTIVIDCDTEIGTKATVILKANK